MSEDTEKRTVAPHIVLAVIILIVILAVVFWPSEDDKPAPAETQPTTEEQAPAPVPEEDNFEPERAPAPVDIDPEREVEPMEPQPEEADPEPLDSSDDGIRTSLESITEDEQVNSLLVDEGLLQRFVVSVNNLANDEMATQQPLKAPEQDFRVYSQAGKQWIDAASYKRYTPYVQMIESMENEALLDLYQQYKPQIQQKFAEIGNPDQPFDGVAISAINQLLDTPEVPVPVEVYSDSVAYKYADSQLENLSEPQKQLLRTGPDNMRRIKAKLREIKAMLEDNGS